MSDTDNLDAVHEVTEADIAKIEAFARRKNTSILVIFFDDMKGSTVLKQMITEQKDEEAFQRLRREHDQLLTQVIIRDDAGEVIKSTGDGLLAAFSEPTTAVEGSIRYFLTLFCLDFSSTFCC